MRPEVAQLNFLMCKFMLRVSCYGSCIIDGGELKRPLHWPIEQNELDREFRWMRQWLLEEAPKMYRM